MIDYGGSLEKLTTPELKSFDSVFPGENWFFYWKTSPSLWEAKFRQYQGPGPIFAPINWALHSEFVDHYDFGENKPEANLARLAQCAKIAGQEIIFLLPLTPAPFLPNGGVPSYLARNMSLNENKLALAVWDAQSQLNRMYSFYDPNTFQAFRKLCWNLGQYLSRNGVSTCVYGLNCTRLEDNKIVSFFEDYSHSFEKGFNRYVKQLQDSEPEKVEKLIGDKLFEKILIKEYEQIISKLYLDSCLELLAGNWTGVIKTCFIGASSKDLFRKINHFWETEENYFSQVFETISNNVYPNSILLSENIKKGSIGPAFSNIVNHFAIKSQLADDTFDDVSSFGFRPLYLFQIFIGNEFPNSHHNFYQGTGLLPFLDKSFPYMFQYLEQLKIHIDDLDVNSIFFVAGDALDEISLKELLKIFMNGHRIFLDTFAMQTALQQKIDLFFTENNLQSEQVNFLCPVKKISLGDGLIISYDGEQLAKNSIAKKSEFWQKMVSFLDLKSLEIQADEDLYYLWKTRSSNAYELSYEDIRRICFFNPSSYKRKAYVKSAPNFAFIKSLDLKKADIKSTTGGIEVHLMPGGSVALDFGHFEA